MVSVLVIDDDPHQLEVMFKQLQMYGHRVAVAENGQKGLDLFKKSYVQLVLMDVVMPNRDGLVSMQKFHEFRPDIPVIVFSASESFDELALELGAVDIIHKPVNMAKLQEKIEKYALVNA